jgi:hypothetical protein
MLVTSRIVPLRVRDVGAFERGGKPERFLSPKIRTPPRQALAIRRPLADSDRINIAMTKT